MDIFGIMGLPYSCTPEVRIYILTEKERQRQTREALKKELPSQIDKYTPWFVSSMHLSIVF